MKIEVRLFANFREYLPKDSDRFSCKLELAEGARISDLLGHLKIPAKAGKIILLNTGPGREEDLLKDGDVVGIFPPIAGG